MRDAGEGAVRGSGAVLILAIWVLTGCAGAQFRLPQISDADIDHAALAVEGDTSKLTSVDRSPAESRALVEAVTLRLEAVAPALCALAETTDCRFEVRYVEDSKVNATTSGDGTIRIHQGLLRYLATEEEVAAVVAHEMGHHISDHVAETQSNATVGAIIGAVLIGGLLGAAGCYSGAYCGSANTQAAMEQGMALGSDIGAISFSKEQEREADLLGAYLLSRAEYDLAKAGELFVVLARMSDDTRASMFDTHPAGPERIAAWEKAIAEVQASPNGLPAEP